MRTHLSHLTAALVATALAGGSTALAQQAPAPPSFEDLSQPTAEVTPHPEYVKAIARSAYVWGWPMVNMLNRRARITQAPEPGLLGGILPVAPQGQIGMLHDYIDPAETFVTCPNQDVVYGLGFFDLDTQPVVVQVPDFGDRFWVYALYDQRTDQFGELGKPYGTKPGFYLLVGPEWDGDVPDGIAAVIRSRTSLANAIPRVFMNDTDEDRKAIQDVIDQLLVYPLADFDGEMKTIDWSELSDIPAPAQQGSGETKWVVPEKFFDEFPAVLDIVPPLPGEEALYAQFRWLMDVAAKDPDLKQAIVDEAVATEKEVIDPFFQWVHNGKAAGNGWNRSVNNADWGVDYFDRAGTAKSNMFDNRPNETQYFYTDFDSSGAALEGSKSYAVTFPAGQEPPVNGFWSLTLYNDKHLFHPNDLDRYSLGTKNGKVQIIASENLVENLVNDVGVVGNILTQRTAYAAGYVPPGPEGPVHFGIGPAFGAGPISFFLPTVEVSASEPLRTTISGIEMEIFHAYGDAGTDEIDVWFPEQRHVHGSETVQGETFPNLYTLRGTSYRDVAEWMAGVGVLLEYARNADSYSGSHMRAWMGNDFIVERIQHYRDAIQYVHDQTIYWMNLGYKQDQLAELVVLPEPYASDPWLQEYYGTVAHSVRNIYNGYLGWWEADATQLARPGFIELSRQYVEAMGGRDAVLAEGQAAVKAENYGWAAEVLTHLTRADPTDAEARDLKAEALRQWSYLQTNIYWRAFGISGSKELDGTLDRSKPWNFADPAIVKVLPTNQILRTMSVRLNAERAAGETVSAQFEVADTGEQSGYQIRNQIAAFTGAMDNADVTLRGPKQAILQTVATGEIADGIELSGDRATAEKFLGLFDVISPNGVNLLLPPDAPLQLDGK